MLEGAKSMGAGAAPAEAIVIRTCPERAPHIPSAITETALNSPIDLPEAFLRLSLADFHLCSTSRSHSQPHI